MEFERALFRIHQRTLHSESVRHLRLQAEQALPWVVLILGAVWAVLHVEYVGRASCLPEALRRAGLWNSTGDLPDLPEDALLGLALIDGDAMLGLRIRSGPPTGSGGSANATRAGGGITVASEGSSAAAGRPRAGHRSGIWVDPERTVSWYKFAFDREVILMRPKVFESHGFSMHNVTLSERCLVPSPILGEMFRLLDGYDTIIMNEIAYTFRSRGYLKRSDPFSGNSIESWAWTADQVEMPNPAEGRALLLSLLRKVALVAKASVTFLLISSITGFFIRVAVNGSAVLMFPVAVAAHELGHAAGGLSLGALTRSFPWIGVHVEVLRRAGRPVWPLFKSHLVFLILQSFAYLSCNLAWKFILYRKSSPDGFEERVFSFCSVLELFNLIFVRTVNSAKVFPRLAWACMVYLHFYVYCSMYPFHSLALATCTAALTYVMVYCVNNFEEPALRGDPFHPTTPTAAHPRALYMPLLSPSWTLEAAPLWTMFWPPEPPSAYPPEAMRHISEEEYLMP